MKKSDILKANLLIYFRFIKSNYLIASEVINNGNRADILYIGKDDILREIEIKTSYSDFLNDFKKKKHFKKLNKETPSYFSFAVNENIKNKVESYLKEHYPKYGLYIIDDTICYNAKDIIQLKKNQNFLKCIIKPKKLNDNKASDNSKKYLIQRMSSELTSLRLEKNYLEKLLKNN